ncbi:MAG: hypothetical protein QW272_08890 [Candidatus Methanomethylicaceae archaeon]
MKSIKEGEEILRIALEDLLNNVFTRNLKEIHTYNLATLKVVSPEAYETISDRKIREALIKSKLFMIGVWKTPFAERDIEIMFNDQFSRDRLLYTLDLTAKFYYKSKSEPHQGKEAVKVFLKSLYIITKITWEAWNNPERLERMERIKNVLRDLTVEMSPSKAEEFFTRVRVDSPILETWGIVAKLLD